MIAALTSVEPILAQTQKSNGAFIYILLIVGLGFYFLIYRPQQKKARALREQSNTFEVGDEVLTAGGIVGHVIDIADDRVTLETSMGASFVVLKQYVIRRLEAAEPEEATEDEDHEGHDAQGSGADDHDATDEDLAGHEFEGEDHAGEPEGDTSHDETTNGGDQPTTGTGGTSGHPAKGDDRDDPTGSSGPPLI